MSAEATPQVDPERERFRFDLRLWRRFVVLAKPYWVGDQRWRARSLLLLLLLLLLGSTGLSVWVNRQLGEFTSALAAGERARFWQAVTISIGLLLCSVPLNAFYYFARDKLAIHWRQWLTHRFVDSYFNNRAFYALTSSEQIDNPDQRITDDINSFTQTSLSFLLIIMEQALQLIAFSGVLWSISPTLVLFLVVYAVAGTVITTFFFGKSLIGLNHHQLQHEGELRYQLVRVRENAEAIALYRGEPQEVAQIKGSFERGFLNFHRLIGMQLRLNLFQYGFSSLTEVLPAIIIANQVLQGEMEVGRLVQATGAFVAVLKAVSLIVDRFDSLSKFAAGIGRLDEFAQALSVQNVSNRRRIKTTFAKGSHVPVVLSHVTVQTPDLSRTLVRNVSLTIDPGQSLLIVGASGGGKSSLLRAIAGLWNAGQGQIIRPHPKQMLFLSQRAYMVVGTLRNQLFYPRLDLPWISNERLAEVLETVNLPNLAERAGGFDVEIDWSKTLSLGEQQRVAFARALLVNPQFLVLDEATSALDIENEERLYRLVSDLGITMISISHRPTTLKFHAQVLELLENDEWRLHRAEDFHFDGHVEEPDHIGGPTPG